MTQDKALAILKSGQNVFLTGSAGTGKTYVLNAFIKHMNKYKIPIAVTASTGIAATHIKGQTIHSWVGMGIKDQMSIKELHYLSSNKALKKKVEKVKTLIIDEISMLHQKQLNLVDQILQHLRDNSKPFGGIQVIFCGDFFQLPPVSKYQEPGRDKFAFMSEAWVAADLKICYLTVQYRQSQNQLGEMLTEIRNGNPTEKTTGFLDELVKQSNDLEPPIRLYTHNADVDKINQKELDALDTPSKKFWATTRGKKELIDTLKKSVIVNEKLELKVGAKVMFVKNNPDKGYINGTLGVIKGYSDLGFPIVKTSRKKEIIATTEEWSIDNETGVSLASFIQIPLRLAWAITIHKSQGMTLDSAELDLRKTFEKGQGYVALSRLKSETGLKLIGYNTTALQVDKLAYKADLRFQELSDLADKAETMEELETAEAAFRKASGGLKFMK